MTQAKFTNNTGNFVAGTHYDMPAENALLGAILLNGGLFDLAKQYINTSEVFYFDVNKQIWEAMDRQNSEQIMPDIFTTPIEIRKAKLPKELDGTLWSYECTSRTRDVYGFENVTEWCLILVQFYIKREQIKHALTIWQHESPLEANRLLTEKIETALQFRGITEWKDMSEVMREVHLRREKIKLGESVGVKTGFIELDEILGGGLETGFHVICARPAMGKTAFALSLILNMAEFGVPVGIISLEMPDAQLGTRLISGVSGIGFKCVFKCIPENGSSKEAEIDRAIRQIETYPIYVADDTQVNLSAITFKVKKLIREKKAKVIFIDYLQLVDVDSSKNEQRYVAVGKLSRGLKVLSKELDIPIVALAQLNRESEGADKQSKIGRVSQLRESGSIEQDMDMGIVIDRPFKRGVMEDENGENTEFHAFVDIQKHRNGEEKLIPIRFNPSTMRFEDKPKAQEQMMFENPRIPPSNRNEPPTLTPLNSAPF